MFFHASTHHYWSCWEISKSKMQNLIQTRNLDINRPKPPIDTSTVVLKSSTSNNRRPSSMFDRDRYLLLLQKEFDLGKLGKSLEYENSAEFSEMTFYENFLDKIIIASDIQKYLDLLENYRKGNFGAIGVEWAIAELDETNVNRYFQLIDEFKKGKFDGLESLIIHPSADEVSEIIAEFSGICEDLVIIDNPKPDKDPMDQGDSYNLSQTQFAQLMDEIYKKLKPYSLK